MAAETAKLVASLELKDNLSAGLRNAGKSVGDFSSKIAKSRAVAVGLGTGLERVAEKGISALGNAIGDGIASAQELERVQQQTQAVIESTGGVAGVTAQQVRDLANATEDLTTVDDKNVQAGEDVLLRYTQIGKSVFPKATKASTDLAVALAKGNPELADVASAAKIVGKALADPVKGITALRKAGIVLTAQQADQIKSLVKAGKTEQAQGVILSELEKRYGAAGKAASEGFGGDIRRANDAIEDAKIALAQGLMPAIGEVAQELTKTLKDPQVQSGIKELGKGLGEGLKGLVSFAKSIPWDKVGQGLSIAAEGAKAIVGAFTSLPPWVQAAVVSGWGLNKLTGGALGKVVGGIFGDLGKGLLQKLGLMKITAGVVQVSGGTVTGGGGAAGAAAGAAKGGLSTLAKVALIGEAIGLVAAVNDVRQSISDASTAQAQAIHTQTTDFIASQPSQQALLTGLAGVDQGIRDLQSNPLHVLVQGDALNQLQGMRSDILKALETTTPGKLADDLAPIAQTSDITALKGKISDDLGTVNQSAYQAGKDAASATNVAKSAIVGGTFAAASGIESTIRANRPITNVNVNVSATTVQKTYTVNTRYGSAGGDRNITGHAPGTGPLP